MGKSKEEMEIRFKAFIDFVKSLLDTHLPNKELNGMEVGVWKGDFSYAMLDQCPRIKKMYGIDAYNMKIAGMRVKMQQNDWEDLYLQVLERFKKFGSRFELIRDTSSKVLPSFNDKIDFAYVDATHKYQSVLNDTAGVERIMNPGGIVMGHDYKAEAHPEVQIAVDEYAAKNGRVVNLWKETIWWWVKQ